MEVKFQEHMDLPISLCDVYVKQIVLSGLLVIVLATGPKVRGFKPNRGQWIFKGDKNL
jgi:hypothetical protein